MNKPDKPNNEAERLSALRNLNLLDTDPEESYDSISRIVKAHFDVPIVAISLVDSERQWFKSIQGFYFYKPLKWDDLIKALNEH